MCKALILFNIILLSLVLSGCSDSKIEQGEPIEPFAQEPQPTQPSPSETVSAFVIDSSYEFVPKEGLARIEGDNVLSTTSQYRNK